MNAFPPDHQPQLEGVNEEAMGEERKLVRSDFAYFRRGKKRQREEMEQQPGSLFVTSSSSMLQFLL
jgi:hypothetical protein